MATATATGRPAHAQWWIFLAGWTIMFGPTYWDLSQTLWRSDEQFHGVIVLLVVAWAILSRGASVVAAPPIPRPALGGALFTSGLLLYVLGRSQDILMLEVGAQIPVLAGALLVLHGGRAVRTLWFPLLYLLFMVPLPGALVDAMTGPLKQWVSIIAEHALYAVGYPIGRNGVMLTIGQYQLLVADACSGLNSMFSLSALGLLFMYLMARGSPWHNGIMLASILPIAFGANILRVMALALLTFHFGDAAGQGFLHGFAGIALLVAALCLLFVLDGLLARLAGIRKPVVKPVASQ